MWQYYLSRRPGEVVVLGGDDMNGSVPQLQSFANFPGATYTLLRNAASPTGGNLDLLYGSRENFVVINKQGIVRMNTYLNYVYGDRYHLDEIRGCIDSLVTRPVAVDTQAPRAWALTCAPNPSRATSAIELAVPAGGAAHASVSVFDLSGRRIATLWDGPAAAGALRLAWDGRAADGATEAPGVYLVRANAGTMEIVRRVIRLR